jgi:hypothetical protein
VAEYAFQHNQSDSEVKAPQTQGTASKSPRKGDNVGRTGTRKYSYWALASFIVTVIAWICLMWQGYVALAIAVMGSVAGFMGVKARRGILRYLAITSVIASLVLIVVMLSFITVFSIVLRTV